MKTDTERRIASTGLNEHEQGLLAQQLKMLRGRTQAVWSYAGESVPADVTIVLARTDDQVALAHLGDVPDSRAIRLEWPLRLFGLIGLLEECETRLATQQPVRPRPSSLAARLGILSEPVVLVHNGVFVHVRPGDDRIHSNVATGEELAKALAQMPNTIEFRPAAGIRELPHQYGCKAMLWALALQESPAPGRDWFKEGVAYRIAAWPVFGEWHSSPTLMRLAALYAREFATVAQGAAFAATTPREIATFLHACECCGLGLDSRTAISTATTARPDEQPQGLLQRLRNRLGLGFKRT